MFPYASKLLTACGFRSKCWFSGPVRIQGTCDMTLHLEGVHICHILKYWLRRLYCYSLSVKEWDKKNWSKWSRPNESAWLKQTAMSSGTNSTRKAQRGPSFVLLTVPQKKVASSRFVGGWTPLLCNLVFWYSFLGASQALRTPPSGDYLGVLDYQASAGLITLQAC